jgi:hypothetical protein
MKLKNLLLVTGGAAIGYVLGTRAGRARFEELKSRANEFVHSPKVQESVSTVADKVQESAQKMPGPAADLVKGAAEQVKHAVDCGSENPRRAEDAGS